MVKQAVVQSSSPGLQRPYGPEATSAVCEHTERATLGPAATSAECEHPERATRERPL